MMIHMAKEAERKAKIAKQKGPKRVAVIDLSEKWLNWTIVALIAFQVFLNISAYNAALSGMNNLSLFFVGLILIVFAGFFHVYRYALNQSKKVPPPPPKPVRERPKMAPQEQPIPELPNAMPGGEAAKLRQPQAEPAPQIQAGTMQDRDPVVGGADLPKP